MMQKPVLPPNIVEREDQGSICSDILLIALAVIGVVALCISMIWMIRVTLA